MSNKRDLIRFLKVVQRDDDFVNYSYCKDIIKEVKRGKFTLIIEDDEWKRMNKHVPEDTLKPFTRIVLYIILFIKENVGQHHISYNAVGSDVFVNVDLGLIKGVHSNLGRVCIEEEGWEVE